VLPASHVQRIITLRYVEVGYRRLEKLIAEFPQLTTEEKMGVAAERFPGFDMGKSI